jgi:hypothetical protein
MTEPIVIDAEVESDPPDTRPFLAVTHKPGVVNVLSTFGARQDIGVSVNPETAADTLWWMNQDWAAQVLANGIELPQLLAPDAGWVATLNREWLNREVGTLRKVDVPRFFAKHPHYLTDHPQVVVSVPGEHTELLNPQILKSDDLAQGILGPFDRLPDNSMVQLDQMLACVVEVRFWIADGQVTAAAPYRVGMVGWESTLFMEMLFNAQGQELTQKAADTAATIAAEASGPPGYAIDMGVTLDGTITVLRAWPAWAADPLHADPVGVFMAITAAHDFEHAAPQWRWAPDMAVYDRAVQESDPPTESENPDDDS